MSKAEIHCHEKEDALGAGYLMHDGGKAGFSPKEKGKKRQFKTKLATESAQLHFKMQST